MKENGWLITSCFIPHGISSPSFSSFTKALFLSQVCIACSQQQGAPPPRHWWSGLFSKLSVSSLPHSPHTPHILQSQDFTQDREIFRFWKRCFFVSLVLKAVHNTIVTCKLNFPSLVMHNFNDLLIHQREAVGRLAQLSATQTPVRIPESRLSNLRMRVYLQLAPSLDCQSVVIQPLQMPAVLDFSLLFVVNDTAELEIDPAPAPSLCLTEQRGCGWALCIGWLDSKERREHTKSM